MRLLNNVTRAVGWVTDRLPMSIGARVKMGRFRYDPADVPPPLPVPESAIRVLIGPTNSAGQAWHFARALDSLDGIAARNVHIVPARDFSFPADTRITAELSVISAPWQRRHFATARAFSHIIVESGRPLFGRLFDGDPEREIVALRRRGVSVAMLAHGSDLRDPARHREIDQWSPYRDDTWDLLPSLQAGSSRFRTLIERVGGPVFVTTPDLLMDWPTASWTPLIVDLDRWRSDEPVLARDRPVVAHAPTNRMIKGTDLIEPVLYRLHDEGKIEYRRHEGIRNNDLPRHIADSDIVIDQVRLGAYGSVSIEAMASGRLAIAHLHEHTIRTIEDLTGETAPIVRATPDTLEQVLRDVLDRRDHARSVAERGPSYVENVHDGRLTAEVLARTFIRGD